MSERHRQARLKVVQRERLWRACLAGLIDLEVCDYVYQVMYGEPLLVTEPEDVIKVFPRRRISVAQRRLKPSNTMYLISDGKLVKVGITGDLKARLSQLQHASGRSLSVERTIESDNAAKLEKAMHMLLGPKRQRGEWFKASAEDWDELLPKAHELAESIY